MTAVLIRSSADWLPVWRARLADLGWTILEAEVRAGLSEGHLSKILRGVKKPSAVTIARLCAALGLVESVSIDVERDAVLRTESVRKKPPEWDDRTL